MKTFHSKETEVIKSIKKEDARFVLMLLGSLRGSPLIMKASLDERVH